MSLAGVVELAGAEHGLGTVELSVRQASRHGSVTATMSKTEVVSWAEASGWTPDRDGAANACVVLSAHENMPPPPCVAA